MIPTHYLPSVNVNWTTSSIDRVKQLSLPKQRAFNRLVVARIELVRLAVVSAIEFCVHSSTATAKFAIAVIQLRGVFRRLMLDEAGVHAVRAVKLAIAILCAPFIGLATPQWSVTLYQRLALVNEPKGSFVRMLAGVRNVATATWTSPCRNPLGLGLIVDGALVANRYLVIPNTEQSFFGRHAGKLGFSVFAVVLCALIARQIVVGGQA